MNKRAMNRLLILLLSGALTGAWSGAIAADGQSEPGLMTKLMVLFSFRMPHVAVPQQIVAPEKDWAIVKGAKAEHAARVAKENQLHEAARRVAERERELRIAREAFQKETSRIAQGTQPESGQQAGANGSPAGEPLQLAARRMTQREQEAYQAKLEYARVAREVREQRRLHAANAQADL